MLKRKEFEIALWEGVRADFGRVCRGLLQYDLSDFMTMEEIDIFERYSHVLCQWNCLSLCLMYARMLLRYELPFRGWLLADGLEEELSTADLLIRFF